MRRRLALVACIILVATKTQAATPAKTAPQTLTVTAAAAALSPVAESQAAAPLAEVPAPPLQTLAVGVGIPDLRLRYALGSRFDVEGKFAFATGLQVYTLRGIWNYFDVGQLKLTTGGEGGVLAINGASGLNGSGLVAGAFLGLEVPFARRFRVSIDAGPAWLQASASGQTFSATDFVYNGALYFYLF